MSREQIMGMFLRSEITARRAVELMQETDK